MYANKLGNLDEINKYLKAYYQNQLKKKIETLNRPITSKEIELVIENYSHTQKAQAPSSLLTSMKHFKN